MKLPASILEKVEEKIAQTFDLPARIPRPPGPDAIQTVKNHLTFAADPIDGLRTLFNKYGSTSYFRLGTFQNYVFTDPEDIEEILLRKNDSFHKDSMLHELDNVLGRGLLTAEGDFWRGQRKLISPTLRRKHIESYADTMVAHTQEMLDEWKSGEVRDFHEDIMGVTLRIVVKTLFNLDLQAEYLEVGDLLEVVLEHFFERVNTAWRFVPQPLPTPMRAKNRHAVERLDTLIYQLIEMRRRQAKADSEAGRDEGNDLLYRLLMAVDEDGHKMDNRQVRDEAMTFLLAGHETTALAITYAWHFMAAHPDAAAKVRDEVDAVLGGRAATVEDVEKLPYTRAFLNETMRIYPPAWIIGREAIEDVEIGGWTIPRGAQVLVPQSVVHMDPRWFEDPEAFRPERWLDGLEKRLPRFAYFPFGGGARVCIGNYFAQMEAVLVVATMAQQIELEDVSPEALRTRPAVTQRPLTAIKMKVTRRS